MESLVFVLIVLLFVLKCDAAVLGDCSPQDDIPCTLYRFTGIDCSPVNLKRNFPFYETNTTKFPGKPGSLNSTLSYRYHPKFGKWFPEANLTFTTPQNAARMSVEGFEVTRINRNNNQTCYIMDLSNVTWDDSSFAQMNAKFHLHLFPLERIQPAFFYFEVYALPKQEKKDGQYDQYQHLFVQFPEYVSEESQTPRNWKATISFTEDSSLGTVYVRIYPPPEEFKFTKFEYTLYNTNTSSSYYTENSHKTSHNFTNVPTGRYQIWVKPINDENRCACKDVTDQVCDNCITTRTKEFNFTYTGLPLPSKPSVTNKATETLRTEEVLTSTTPENDVTELIIRSTTESREVYQVQVAMAVLGTVLGLALAVVAGLIYHRKCRKIGEKTITNLEKQDIDGSPKMSAKNPAFADDVSSISAISNFGQINNGNAEKVRLNKKQKLFLLYEDDHEKHRQVVNHFATYLQQHCQCVVMCVEWQLDAPWVHQDLEQADYVVIVNSEGAFTTYMNNYGLHKESPLPNMSPSTKRMSSINSVRNKFLHDERYDNIVMVYFSYTDEKYVLPDICPGYKYLLPKHFTDFLLHIHKLHRTDNLLQYDLPLDGNHSKRPIGQQLLESIAAAEQYQLKNPNWLQKRFGYSRMYSHGSDDKCDSGFPEDLSSPTQTPQCERLAPFINQRETDYLHLLEGRSVCTVNPSDLGIALHNQEPNILPPFTEETNVSHVPKQRPKLSPHSFTANADQVSDNSTPPPPTCSTEESDFAFFPPEDFDEEFDVKSKTQSEQMKSIVDRYQADNNFETSQFENPHGEGNQLEGYDRNRDLLLLKVHSGELPFINCNMSGDVVSLGGESV